MEEQPNRREEGESEQKVRPRIYVASLSDYNEGRLHGGWFDANREPEELEKEIGFMLACSPEPVAEEWAIHDHEGFGLAYISEYESLETVSRLARGIAEHGLAFAAWAAIQSNDEEALGRFGDAYLGNWESLEEYADELLFWLDLDEAQKLLPESIRPYLALNVEAFARDLELGGDVITVKAPDGSVWVFDGHV
jgi:antirestriction protein